jgi:phosphotransferase system HPr (HPr) family protein
MWDQMAQQRRVVIRCKDGLHARPAMQLAELARKFSSSVKVTKESRVVDGKSILEVLTLAADNGTELVVDVDGEDEEEAIKALIGFLDTYCS